MKLEPEQIAQISQYLMPDIQEEPSDIGFLFGTRHGIEEFCLASFALWQRRMFEKLLISGGCTRGEPESEASIIGRRLLQMGMPRDALVLEHEATNTGENVIYGMQRISEVMDIDRITSVLAIGKICSTRRYLMTLERHWPIPKKFACPINYFGLPKDCWSEHEEFRERVLSEVEKIPRYLKSGFLREVAGLPPYPDFLARI
jgi:hypothetical protein